MSPKVVSRRKVRAYRREREASSSVNICEGCPYDYGCCKSGETLLLDEEVARISLKMNLVASEFVDWLSEAEARVLLLKLGVSVLARMKTPCTFLNESDCLIHAFKPRGCKFGVCDYAFNRHKQILAKASDKVKAGVGE